MRGSPDHKAEGSFTHIRCGACEDQGLDGHKCKKGLARDNQCVLGDQHRTAVQTLPNLWGAASVGTAAGPKAAK